MMRRLTWGLLGFAAGAYMILRTDRSTRRAWGRQARRLGRRMERATEQALRVSGVKWVNDTVDALTSK